MIDDIFILIGGIKSKLQENNKELLLLKKEILELEAKIKELRSNPLPKQSVDGKRSEGK